jgi:hypothetical protein
MPHIDSFFPHWNAIYYVNDSDGDTVIFNETNDNVTFTYNRCVDGNVVSLSAPRGSVRTVCVSPGGDVYDPSGILTITACGTTCSINGDCADCV